MSVPAAMLALLLALQGTAGPPVPPELRVIRPCPSANDTGDIVVCDRTVPSQRLEKLPERVVASPSEAMSFRIPGVGKGRVHAIQSNVGGFTSQGAAITLTAPFGKKKAKE